MALPKPAKLTKSEPKYGSTKTGLFLLGRWLSRDNGWLSASAVRPATCAGDRGFSAESRSAIGPRIPRTIRTSNGTLTLPIGRRQGVRVGMINRENESRLVRYPV